VVSPLPGELEQLLKRQQLGLTYQPGCPHELIACLTQFLNSPGMTAEMGQRPRMLAEKEFAAPKTVARMAQHLEAPASAAS
jgi:hypothetical protein